MFTPYVGAGLGYGWGSVDGGSDRDGLAMAARSVLELRHHGRGAPQPAAELTSQVRQQMDGDRRVVDGEGVERFRRQHVADQVLIGRDRGRARLPVEQCDLAEDGAG